MSKLSFIVSNQTNPYLNVAVENYLLAQPEADEVVLYLWSNHRTVVVGQNQNPYAECNLERLAADGGYLMRRRTGGGAVYHDGGNLNFSFIVPHQLYDVERQLGVIISAVGAFGLQAEPSGRNDLLCGGRKFSGNAFAVGRHRRLHHGTLLIAGNMADLQLYLKPKPAKLQKHGVASVQSRVVNLAELNPAITCQTIQPQLLKAFEQAHGATAEEVDFGVVASCGEVQRLCSEFASDEWLYGPWRHFKAHRQGQFDWGGIEVSLEVDSARRVILRAKVATDALDLEAIARAERLLQGASLDCRPVAEGAIERDIIDLVY